MDACDLDGRWTTTAIDTALDFLRAARDDLIASRRPARVLAASIDWDAPAARAFHAGLEELVREVARLEGDVDEATAALERERVRYFDSCGALLW